MTTPFSGELPDDIDPEAHGLPFERATRFFAVGDLLAKLRNGELRAFGRPTSMLRPFCWIAPREWEAIPEASASNVFEIGGTHYRAVHIHDTLGLPSDEAALAFGDYKLTNEFLALPEGARKRGLRSWANGDSHFEKCMRQADELRLQLESALLTKLTDGRLIASGCPLMPVPQLRMPYSPPPNVGFTMDFDGSKQRQYEAEHLARWMEPRFDYLPAGDRQELPARWWQRPGAFQTGSDRLTADGRYFGDILVRLPPPGAAAQCLPRDTGGAPRQYDREALEAEYWKFFAANPDATERQTNAHLISWVNKNYKPIPSPQWVRERRREFDRKRREPGSRG